MAKVFVINGYPGSGKDTFVKFIQDIISGLGAVFMEEVINLHTSDPAKQALTLLGWDGVKSHTARDLLAEIMSISAEYWDGPFKYISKKVSGARTHDIIFIHSREWTNIQRYKKEFGAITVFIDRPDLPLLSTNASDLHSTDRKNEYDIVINNIGTIQDLKAAAERFFVNQI